MRSVVHACIAAVLLVVHPAPAVAEPPADLTGKLLVAKDLPPRYTSSWPDPYTDLIGELLKRGDLCRLPVDTRPAHAVKAVFVTRDRQALEVETLTEVLSAPGESAARRSAATLAALPDRCPQVETPRYTIKFTPAALPSLGDATGAVGIEIAVKAVSDPNAYVDALFAEAGVVVSGRVAVAVVLTGYYRTHELTLAEAAGAAVRKLAPM
ncbi:hypothetical protein [Actinoplanes sp. NBRC 101535]|uniref:hypothetical protein n=1 Tax=Actinoplanes sp. NBRC 101535 TaxID=3032196 RepID=UPI0024A4BAD2|nr:hypothetical protein [Actinoplanes sp. NBRC 101535]GLY03985.1 hypothetical protein Acsp01_43640 [Actinoplanes sp. NBRC 101535]